MGAFQDIELVWKGKTFTIQSHRVMGAIYRIEEVITLQEFMNYSIRGTAPLGKLSGAYASVLRYAGAKVKDEEVYAECFEGPEQQAMVMTAVANMIQMMLPPSAREKMRQALEEITTDSDESAPEEVGNDEGNSSAASVTNPSLKRHLKRRSLKPVG